MDPEPLALTTLSPLVFEMVIEHSLDGVIIGDPGGGIRYANPAACELFRSTVDELRRLGRSGIIDPDSPAWPELIEERGRTGQVRGVAPMLRSDGTTFLAGIASSVFATPDGEERTCWIVRDVTVQVRWERALAAYNDVAEALLGGAEVKAVLDLVAEHARILFDATDASVTVPAEPPDDVVVVAAAGPTSIRHLGRRYPAGSLARRVMDSREPMLIADMQTEAPFEEGRDIGPGSAMVVPIISGDDVFGVLMVGVAAERRRYQGKDLQQAAQYARRSALVIALAETRAASERQQRRLNLQLKRALESRVVIEQAKGVILATRQVTPDEAFQRLRAYARSHNQVVHDVARAVVDRKLMI